VRQIIGSTLALLPVSLIPVFTGHAGIVYLVGAGILGAGFLYCGVRMAVRRTNVLARQLLMASIVHLPLVLALLMFDQRRH
jgi:heme o synthase